MKAWHLAALMPCALALQACGQPFSETMAGCRLDAYKLGADYADEHPGRYRDFLRYCMEAKGYLLDTTLKTCGPEIQVLSWEERDGCYRYPGVLGLKLPPR